MAWDAIKKRMTMSGPQTSAPFVLPSVVLEVESEFVAGARLDSRGRQVQRLGMRELDPGTVSPLPNRQNISNLGAVRKAVNEVVDKVAHGGGRIGLLLPDAAVRVATLAFETLPNDRREAESLVRWKMRETLPFEPEEGRVSYQILSQHGDSVELLAVAVRNSVLAEYESALEGVNGGAALILPATLALLPLLPEDSGASHLLAHMVSSSVTTVVVSGNRVGLWRTHTLRSDAPEEIAESVGREVARVMATARDHLHADIDQVWICSRPPLEPELSETLSEHLRIPVRSLAGGTARTGSLPPADQEVFRRYGMPFAGLAANAG